MAINPNIFKAYDIRDNYPEDINEEAAYLIGRASVVFLQAREIVVGRDMRLSSPALSDALIRGITDEGADVIDIGLSTTPMFYYAVYKLKADAGVIITASHNPKNDNGFKLVRRNAVPISQDSGIIEIRNLVLTGKFAPVLKKGEIIKKEILNDYLENIFKLAELDKLNVGYLKIVADAGNGMAGLILPKFFQKINCQVTPLFWDLDGNFPNHIPNPLDFANLITLKKRVIAEKADLGIAFDGDVDRVVFINEKGKGIKICSITALIAKEILKEEPNSKIIIDVRTSRMVKDIIEENGGQAILSKTGHSFIKELMIKEDAVFAAERSAHYYFKKAHNFESPLLAIAYVLRVISREKKLISEIVALFQKYYSPEQADFRVKDRQAILEKVENFYRNGRISHLDGLTVEFDDWWFNLRASNTDDEESLIRLNLEAKTEQLIIEKLKEIERLMVGG